MFLTGKIFASWLRKGGIHPDIVDLFTNEKGDCRTSNDSGTPVEPLTAASAAPTNDPELQRFDELYFRCHGLTNEAEAAGAGAPTNPLQIIIQLENCVTAMKQAQYQFCTDFNTVDTVKCAHVSREDVNAWMYAMESLLTVPIFRP